VTRFFSRKRFRFVFDLRLLSYVTLRQLAEKVTAPLLLRHLGHVSPSEHQQELPALAPLQTLSLDDVQQSVVKPQIWTRGNAG
jgi:hypothetical protein